jgi:hypothetical protein
LHVDNHGVELATRKSRKIKRNKDNLRAETDKEKGESEESILQGLGHRREGGAAHI